MPGQGRVQCLSEAASLLILCRDCGHSRVWFTARLQRRIAPGTSLDTFAARLFCRSCRDEGGDARNITVEAFPAAPQRSAVA